MARRKRRPPSHCRRCKLERLPDERWLGGFCPECRDFYSAKRRKATAKRVLAGAKTAGTVERDGQTFTVLQLPPKRRGGWKR
jgi:hypothetical protein